MFDHRLITVECHSPDRPPSDEQVVEWERFVAACPSVHVEQLWVWGEVRRIDGWTPALFTVHYAGSLVAGALILVRRVKRFFNIGYICRGPLITPSDEINEAALCQRVAEEWRTCARKLRLAYTAVAPPYHAGCLPDALRRVGFFPHIPSFPPSGLMTGTLLIDLQHPEDTLKQGFRRTLRQDLGKAERGGVTVRDGDEQDIERLWCMMNDLCRRRGTRPNVSDIEVMRRLWRALRPSGRIRIDVAEVAQQPVAALMTMCMGSWAIPWRIGWSGEHPKLNPEKYLYWSVLRAVRDQGYTVFDFNWVDTAEVGSIQTDVASPPSKNTGITFMKTGFGGRVIPVGETLDFISNPVVRMVFKRVQDVKRCCRFKNMGYFIT